MKKFVGFRSDSTRIMLGSRNKVVTKLKEEVDHFLSFIHRVVHRTNLVSVDIACARSHKGYIQSTSQVVE